jgi:hypothetical protein
MKENLWRLATTVAFVLLVTFAYSAAVTEFGPGVAVNPQSQEIANNLCAEVGEYFDWPVAGVRVTAGINVGDGQTTDTVVCDFAPNGTLPYTIFYQDGEFAGYI